MGVAFGGFKGVKTFPYRLPELLAAVPSHPVYICEGEKDVENLRERGLVASSNPMGAGKWHDEYSEWFRRRDCIALGDNDDSGRDHQQVVARS